MVVSKNSLGSWIRKPFRKGNQVRPTQSLVSRRLKTRETYNTKEPLCLGPFLMTKRKTFSLPLDRDNIRVVHQRLDGKVNPKIKTPTRHIVPRTPQRGQITKDRL